ncbi:DNA cytosine methyltransferase [Vitiosangium sp. GDMCC 1.1324]|uniref:DNA cytosine methyltransferase n=1 Tax=Vitiosangium sp. (strain GDMCC 1.1324) TaxID=2138576 RepID=UPI000D372D8F|nr:DNA cytosine methyltransferase [Vitiosangium sp. GDMCC 1.1324]PTL77018.1 DNA cytosine methyltransferase [Vitiosangium sp. GDMCC 1.1324]
MLRPIDHKLDRLARGERPRLLDLFSGCGGLTLGFHRAGCEVVCGVEFDEHAARSHALNFHRHLPPELFEAHAAPKDITVTGPHALLQSFGVKKPEYEVDVLVGGPPCPAFTRVGRAKLREVHEHPEAFRHDPRAKLYLPYLEYVKALKPVALLMENVPDILNFGGHNLAEEVCEVLEGLGYRCVYTLVNAANYGVPQMRERFILVGIHEAAGAYFSFPAPTRKVDFPPGYQGSRDVALKHIVVGDLFAPRTRYVPTPEARRTRRPPVTVREALADLPPITGHLEGTIRRGARRFDNAVTYRPDVVPSDYARLMRTWPGFEGDGQIWDHAIRSLSDRDYRLFRAMRWGDDYPKAYALAERLFTKRLAEEKRAGHPIDPGSAEYEALRSDYVPPYDPGKFPNKWRKMEPDEPARTLMAHLGKDSYSHIHYDSDQARVLSVREAARLQSFPDGFEFSGTMNPAFRQIGNAVPPLLAHALAEPLLASIGVAHHAIAGSHREAKVQTSAAV